MTIELRDTNEIFENFLSKDQIAEAEKEADLEMALLKELQDDVSKFASKTMVEKNLGFREFAKKNGLSLSMASKILKGSQNLTLETIAYIAACNGKKVKIVFNDNNEELDKEMAEIENTCRGDRVDDNFT
jgi:transcriptional regulator with XRE-family HTH domain